jgi:hypothetical protein
LTHPAAAAKPCPYPGGWGQQRQQAACSTASHPASSTVIPCTYKCGELYSHPTLCLHTTYNALYSQDAPTHDHHGCRAAAVQEETRQQRHHNHRDCCVLLIKTFSPPTVQH